MPRSLYVPELLLLAAGLGCWLMLGSEIGSALPDHEVAESARTVQASAAIPKRERAPAPRDWIGRRRDATPKIVGHAIRGFVRGPGGEPIADAVVYAHELGPHDRQRSQQTEPADELVAMSRYSLPPIAKTRSREDGSYELVLPQRAREWFVDLGCFRSGYERRFMRDFGVPGSGTSLDWALGRGLCLRGFVTDPDGAPVADLRIRVSRRWFPGRPFRSTAQLDTSIERCADRWSSFAESTTTTDAGGWFSVTGLSPGRYTIISESRDWLVWPAQAVRVPTADLHVVVAPASSLTIDIDAGEVDIPVDKPRVSVAIRTPTLGPDGQPTFATYTLSGLGRGSSCQLRWTDTDKQGRAVTRDIEQDVFVKVELPGFETHRSRMSWNFARDKHKRLQLELEPLDLRDVLLSAQYSNGTQIENDLVVEYAASQSEVVGTATAKRVAPWLHRCRLPVGAWFVRVYERSAFGAINDWRGEVQVVTRSKLAGIVLAKGGSVSVHAPPGMSMRGLSLIGRGDELGTEIETGGDPTVLDNVPAGTWELRLSKNGERLGSRRIEVRAGGRHAVRF